MPVTQICYSDKYSDDHYEYRHVILPKNLAELVPRTHLMTESEWRNLGVQQSPGWMHYLIHEPGEPREACGDGFCVDCNMCGTCFAKKFHNGDDLWLVPDSGYMCTHAVNLSI